MRFHFPLGPVLVFGEVLFDKFPHGRRIGGAPFNYAYHLHNLGIPVYFISRVGDDEAGREILKFLQDRDFPVEGIQVDPAHATGEVVVTLDDGGNPTFDILPDRAYDHIEYDSYLASLEGERIPLIYHGTLIQRHEDSRRTLEALRKKFFSRSTIFVDMNLRAPFYDRGVLENTLQNCDILKVNGNELRILQKLFEISGSRDQVAREVMLKYRIGMVCVTEGLSGNRLFVPDRERPYVVRQFEAAQLVDSVGAGDAFSAMMSACHLADLNRQTMLEYASRFASKVCEVPGAVPEDPEFYKPFRFA